MWKYVLAWFPMLLIAIANGAVRDLGYKKYVGELKAHQISTVSACLLFGVYIWAIVHVWRPDSGGMAFAIGFVWLFLTLLFEFGFGRARGVPWSVLLRDYNLAAGRLWPIILLVVTFSPYLFYSL